VTTIPSLGASGAIYGLLVAFGILFWDRYITLLIGFFLPVTIKVKYLVIGLGLIALYSGLKMTPDGIGHFAHLGGMVVGWLYVKFIKPDLRWGESIFNQKTRKTGLSKWLLERLEKWRQTEATRRRQQEARIRGRVDLILDKINEVGYENLTEEEKQILKNASENLSQGNSQ
ncbi:MAG: rhomboid family intramembrane serine protease, partial [bacterium]